MSHFGVLSYKGAGHLNPLIALSRQLVARGHDVTFIQTEELEERVRVHGLAFRSIGSLGNRPARRGGGEYRWQFMRDIVVLRDGIDRIVYDMEFFLRQAPAALVAAGVDTLIMDEITLAGPTLAQILRLPYIVVSTSVPHNFGWHRPQRIAEGTIPFERVRQALLEVSVLRMRGPVRSRLDKLRRSRGLGSIRRIQQVYPELAHITQLPRCLDFPRGVIPRNFHFAGPFVDDAARPALDFPWERLDGRTMVYASLGTSRSSDPGIFHLIAGACSELGLQLVISLGGRRDPESLSGLPGGPIVVKDLPQLQVLKRADMVISHGGLNTTLETLMEGKPMIVIPRAFDQHAVAARLEWWGVAEVLAMKELSMGRILAALRRILSESGYREAAMKMKVSIRSSCGLEHAADVIEESLRRHVVAGWDLGRRWARARWSQG
jgi:zeaxanthin glucosyltransferase